MHEPSEMEKESTTAGLRILAKIIARDILKNGEREPLKKDAEKKNEPQKQP